MNPTYTFIIPAFNEADVIEEAIQRTAAYARTLGAAWELIVVDDGSTDGTADVAQRLANRLSPLIVLRLSPNQGKGAAVRAGMLAAHGTWRIFLDADLSTTPEMFERFRPWLERYDILIASRGLPGSRVVRHQSVFRESSGRLFNAIVRRLLHIPFRDTQCGFKAYHMRVMDIFVRQEFPGWAFDVEVLTRAQSAGFRTREVPVVWMNDPSSTVRFLSALGAVADIWKIRQRSRNW